MLCIGTLTFVFLDFCACLLWFVFSSSGIFALLFPIVFETAAWADHFDLDLNSDYTPLDEYTQLPSTQVEDAQDYTYGRSFASLVAVTYQHGAATVQETRMDEPQHINDARRYDSPSFNDRFVPTNQDAR